MYIYDVLTLAYVVLARVEFKTVLATRGARFAKREKDSHLIHHCLFALVMAVVFSFGGGYLCGHQYLLETIF